MQVDIDKIEKFRIRKNLSKGKFAEIIGYSTPGGYSNLLRFKHIPSRDVMRRLSMFMKCNERNLLT